MYEIVAFTDLLNVFSLDVYAAVGGSFGMLGDVSASVFATCASVPLIGSLCLVPPGLVRGCFFFALPIVLLVLGSLVVAYITSTDHQPRSRWMVLAAKRHPCQFQGLQAA